MMIRFLLLFYISSLLLVVPLSDGANRGAQETESSHVLTTSDKKSTVCDPSSENEECLILKEAVYEEDDVVIHYPQVENNDHEADINEIMKEQALKGLNFYESNEALSLEINYEVKYNRSGILSVHYTGVGYVQGAAHPNQLSYTMNIDVADGTLIKLTDMVNINDTFARKFTDGSFQPVNEAQEGVLEGYYSTDKLAEQLQHADTMNGFENEYRSETYSYMTEDSIGISIGGLGHGAGGYVVYEIKYEQIDEYLKVDMNGKAVN